MPREPRLVILGYPHYVIPRGKRVEIVYDVFFICPHCGAGHSETIKGGEKYMCLFCSGKIILKVYESEE